MQYREARRDFNVAPRLRWVRRFQEESMKLWGIAMFSLVLATSGVHAETAPDTVAVKDSDGNTWAVVVTCTDCQSTAAKKTCHSGVEEGWVKGQPCGKCLVNENAGTKFRYPYDLHVTGTLVDTAGKPVKERFIKMFMANGWNVRTRTFEDGKFRLILGAMDERKSQIPMVTDIGVRVDPKDASKAHYALYLMPESYKPCSEQTRPPGEEKRTKKKQ